MKRFSVLKTLSVVGLCLACFLTYAEAPKPKPNIIVIMVDDLGWSGLSCTGSKFYETKNIDELARTGALFTNAYAAAHICSPTRAAFLTGKHPARTGITDWIRAELDDNAVAVDKNPVEYVIEEGKPLACPPNPYFMELKETTLAEYLKEAGYATCHVGKWHLGPENWYPTQQGFDHNIGGCGLGFPPSYFDPYKRGSFDIPTLPSRKEGEFLTDRLGDEVVSFIEANVQRPFFINWMPYAVHRPLEGKPELIDKYKKKKADDHNNPVYAAIMETLDDNVGKLLKCLDRLGLRENTLIVFTSDNGGLLPVTPNYPAITSNLPLRSGKGYPYEGGLRVPLIINWPGVTKAETLIDVPVITMDLSRTIIDAAGIKLDAGAMDGQNLIPLLKNPRQQLNRDFVWHFPHYRQVPDGIPHSVIRSGNFKLIHFYGGMPDELFDLANDPYELENIYNVDRKTASTLKSKLDDWLASFDAKLPRKVNSSDHH